MSDIINGNPGRTMAKDILHFRVEVLYSIHAVPNFDEDCDSSSYSPPITSPTSKTSFVLSSSPPLTCLHSRMNRRKNSVREYAIEFIEFYDDSDNTFLETVFC